MNNEPQYLIYGKDRRDLKKKLSELKMFLKYNATSRDLEEVYGTNSNVDNDKYINDLKERINNIEKRLKIPYK